MSLEERPGSIPGALLEEMRRLRPRERDEHRKALKPPRGSRGQGEPRKGQEKPIPPNHPQREKLLKARAARENRASS